jgi:hypothetical protein
MPFANLSKYHHKFIIVQNWIILAINWIGGIKRIGKLFRTEVDYEVVYFDERGNVVWEFRRQWLEKVSGG